MSLISVCWYSLTTPPGADGRNKPTGLDAGELADAAARLNLSQGVLRARGGLRDFDNAVQATRVHYVDAQEKKHTLAPALLKRTPKTLAYYIQREDGLRLGQVRFLGAKMDTQLRIVPGTQVFKSLLTPGMAESERTAAQVWIAKFEKEYRANRDDVTYAEVINLLTRVYQRVTIPVPRKNVAWAYDDEAGSLRVLRDLLVPALEPNLELAVLPLVDPVQTRVFVGSADAFMSSQIRDLLGDMSQYQDQPIPPPRTLKTFARRQLALAGRVALHESRLSLPLPQAQSGLLRANRMMDTLTSTDSLPSVSEG